MASCACGAVDDPAFKQIPFAQWATEHDKTPLRLKIRAKHTTLSMHQRLLAQVGLRFDGIDLVPRAGQGKLWIFVEVESASKERYRDHGEIDLAPVQVATQRCYVEYLQQFFALPGAYRFTAVVWHPKTGEHWVRRTSVKVDPLREDPLANAWHGLPEVEFALTPDSPEGWFQPRMRGKLQLDVPAGTELEILMNVSAPTYRRGRLAAENRNLAVLIPALKVLSQIGGDGVRKHITLLDLAKQKVIYEQNGTQALDCEKALASMEQSSPATIDVGALARQGSQAAYFHEQVLKRLAPNRVLVILSGNEPLYATNAPLLEATLPPGATIHYLRYREMPVMMIDNIAQGGRRGTMVQQRTRLVTQPEDRLSASIKNLHPVIADIPTPLLFRKALAAVLASLAARK